MVGLLVNTQLFSRIDASKSDQSVELAVRIGIVPKLVEQIVCRYGKRIKSGTPCSCQKKSLSRNLRQTCSN